MYSIPVGFDITTTLPYIQPRLLPILEGDSPAFTRFVKGDCPGIRLRRKCGWAN